MPLPSKFPAKTSKKSKKVEKRVLANRYTVHKRLGSGNFGTAWIIVDGKAKEDRDKLKALKEIPVGELQPDETIEAVHEASLLRNLDHPGIVKFHDSFIDGEFFCIVTEYCEGGDLDQKISKARKEKGKIAEGQVIEWLIQLLLALQYMHDRRVLHRDLKARNIFLRNNVIKVGDFGISRILMGTTDMASTFVGTPYYMSPEVLKHEGYNSKSDVWSIGCILFEMCALRHAFEGQSLMGVMYKIVEGSLPEWPEEYSTELKGVFENLLIKDPLKRPSASESLKLPFIARQMEDLKNTMMDKHHQKEQRDNIRSESQQLWQDLKKETKIDQLRKEAEEQKWKNMSPRERMRFKKQQAADEEAKKLRLVALQQQLDNKMKYNEIKRNNDPFETHEKKEEEFDFQGSVEEQQRKKGPAFTDYRALETSARLNSRDEDSGDSDSASDDENSGTVVENPRPTKPTSVPTTPTVLPPPRGNDPGGHKRSLSHTTGAGMGGAGSGSGLGLGAGGYDYPQARTLGEFSRTFAADERPITPMRDRMVYDVEHSTLDFEDGVPGRPDLAETYYSQFEDFEKDEEDDEEGEGGGRGGGGHMAATQGSEDSEGTLVAGADEDVEDLINCMQNALDKEDTLKSQTLADNSSTSAFGPIAREMKMKNLRLDAISKLGEEGFNRVYTYLKEARFNSKNKQSPDESQIMTDLNRIVKNSGDCFLVDQLLFLEAQANIS